MSNSKKTIEGASGGSGFCGLLTIAFIVLKLCGVIQWSWLWVLSPLWIGFVIVAALMAIAVVVYLLSLIVAGIVLSIQRLVSWK